MQTRHAVIAPFDLHRNQKLREKSSRTVFWLGPKRDYQFSIPYQLLNSGQLPSVRLTSRLNTVGRPSDYHHNSETRRSIWRIHSNHSSANAQLRMLVICKPNASRFDLVNAYSMKAPGLTTPPQNHVLFSHCITQLAHQSGSRQSSLPKKMSPFSTAISPEAAAHSRD